MLCVLAAQEPKSFADGATVQIDNSWLRQANSKNYHHFFPKAYLKKKGEDEFRINHIANITIVDDFLNKRIIRDRAPSNYMQEFAEKNENLEATMATHLMKDLDTIGIWNDDDDTFFKQRISFFAEELKKRILT